MDPLSAADHLLRCTTTAQLLGKPFGHERVLSERELVLAEQTASADKLQKRADEAWSTAGLERITLHECRHSFASLMIAAGVNAKALSTFMGHATGTTLAGA